ncbi:MAG: hydrogenase maturation protease [Candidatus Eisenbacteria bacterium]
MTMLTERIQDQLHGRSVVVVGVGNRLRGDDGAGPAVVERLAGAGRDRVIDAGTTPENFLGPLLERAPGVVLFVDAADLGEPPGATVLAPVAELAGRIDSTHAPSLRLVADILASYGIESWLLGIQPARTTPGVRLHPEVAAAVDTAAESIAWILCREVCRG